VAVKAVGLLLLLFLNDLMVVRVTALLSIEALISDIIADYLPQQKLSIASLERVIKERFYKSNTKLFAISTVRSTIKKLQHNKL